MTVKVNVPQIKNRSPFMTPVPVVYYPDSDGQPMAENDPQYDFITDTHFALEQRYREETDAYVSANLLIYYVEGDPGKSVAPDILVSFGIPKGDRRSYFIWLEGKAPDVVFEIASENTWQADVGWKRGLYQGLGIQEYFIVDPSADYLDVPLLGYQLQHEVYTPLPALTGHRDEIGLSSQILGLELWLKPNPVFDPTLPKESRKGLLGPARYILRLFDPDTQQWLRTPAEAEQARIEAENRADTAEAEVVRLQEELARLRGQDQ